MTKKNWRWAPVASPGVDEARHLLQLLCNARVELCSADGECGLDHRGQRGLTGSDWPWHSASSACAMIADPPATYGVRLARIEQCLQHALKRATWSGAAPCPVTVTPPFDGITSGAVDLAPIVEQLLAGHGNGHGNEGACVGGDDAWLIRRAAAPTRQHRRTRLLAHPGTLLVRMREQVLRPDRFRLVLRLWSAVAISVPAFAITASFRSCKSGRAGQTRDGIR